MPAQSLLAYLADELAAPASVRARRASSRRCDAFNKSLRRISAEGQHTVVAIDEAHLIDDTRTFEALRLLLNFESESQPGLTLLLVGQPGLLAQIDRMPAFEERLGVKCLLRPFNTDETSAYVNFRLQAAGAKKPIFEPEAMTTLQELSHGLPRQINRLCDLALLVGFAEERRPSGRNSSKRWRKNWSP